MFFSFWWNYFKPNFKKYIEIYFAIFFHSNFGSTAIFITISGPHCYALLVIINFFFLVFHIVSNK